MIKTCLAIALLLSNSAFAAEYPKAVFHTTVGSFVCELYPDKAPVTVENFTRLAQGEQSYIHPVSGNIEKKPLYNGTKFHRTMPGFMIQGGDIRGNSTGDPGYTFPDEPSDLTFDQAGMLAMANRGPNTNGCQFFITVAPQRHLNGKSTIFGRCISGQEVVEKISKLPSQPGTGKALEPVVINSVEILASGTVR